MVSVFSLLVRGLASAACVSLLAACGPPDAHPITTGPKIVRTPSGCARQLSDGKFINDKLGTGCHFTRFNGARVCVPDNMPLAIGGTCSPTGPDKVQIGRKDGCGDGSNRFVIYQKDKTVPLSCDDIQGSIRVVVDKIAADQNLYLGDPVKKTCVPSGLMATLPDYPYIDLVVPAVLLYETDMPSEVCK